MTLSLTSMYRDQYSMSADLGLTATLTEEVIGDKYRELAVQPFIPSQNWKLSAFWVVR
jgi:hypothetical protein